MLCYRCGSEIDGKHKALCNTCRNEIYLEKKAKICPECKNRFSATGKKTHCSKRCKILGTIEINENGCWIWTDSKDKSGHARWFDYETGKRVLIHRLIYEMYLGEIPPGKFICHNCPNGDNPSCCNPYHLFVGTPKDNMKDAKKKGTMKYGLKPGEEHYSATLSEEQVKKIRKEYTEGKTRKELAKTYDQKLDNIHKIIQRKSWKHLQ